MRTGFFILSACCFLVGCGSSTGSRTAEEEHLRKLGTYYSRYLAQHKGMPPGTLDDLKAFMKKEGVPAEGFDALFVSPRDGEAYVVHLKKRVGPPRADGPIVLHEKSGKDGKRIVALATGEVRAMEEAAFQKSIKQ